MRGGNSDGKPRGRSTAYAYFVQHCRAEHKRTRPNENVVFADFSRQCAGRWKNITENDKKHFADMATHDKTRYDEEMQHYVPPKGSKKGGSRRKKDPNAPKRALSAFFWFCHDERPAVRSLNPEFKVGDIAKVLGRRWSEVKVNPEVLRKYESMADRDKARYEREMEMYKDQGKRGVQMGHPQGQEEEYDDDEDDEDDE